MWLLRCIVIATLAVTTAPAQMQPWEAELPAGSDTINDFQGVCFGWAKMTAPETYWAGVCRYQRFDDGDWRVVTSASPIGPIDREYGPVEIDALVEYEDVKVFPLSVFFILGDWGNIFIAPRDIDVQLEIARIVNQNVEPGTTFGVVAEAQRINLTVSNFTGQNFGGGRPVNLVEVYADQVEQPASSDPSVSSSTEKLRLKQVKSSLPILPFGLEMPEVEVAPLLPPRARR